MKTISAPGRSISAVTTSSPARVAGMSPVAGASLAGVSLVARASIETPSATGASWQYRPPHHGATTLPGCGFSRGAPPPARASEPAPAGDMGRRPQQDLDVVPQRPVGDVEVVDRDHLTQ